MALNVEKEVAALRRMTVDELRAEYAHAFGEGTKTRHKAWLARRIAWRIQALAEGDLSERARQRAAELANDADLRTTAPKADKPNSAGHSTATSLHAAADGRLPIAGTLLTRQYKGQTLAVHVRPDGFEYEGEVYKSLSAVAKKITGSHCSGYLFFRLTKEGGAR